MWASEHILMLNKKKKTTKNYTTKRHQSNTQYTHEINFIHMVVWVASVQMHTLQLQYVRLH